MDRRDLVPLLRVPGVDNQSTTSRVFISRCAHFIYIGITAIIRLIILYHDDRCTRSSSPSLSSSSWWRFLSRKHEAAQARVAFDESAERRPKIRPVQQGVSSLPDDNDVQSLIAENKTVNRKGSAPLRERFLSYHTAIERDGRICKLRELRSIHV